MKLAPNTIPAHLSASGCWFSPTGQFIDAALTDFETLAPYLSSEVNQAIQNRIEERKDQDGRIENYPEFQNLEEHDESLDGALEGNLLQSQSDILDILFQNGFVRVEHQRKKPAQVIGTSATAVAAILMKLPFPAKAATRTSRSLVDLPDYGALIRPTI
jgi:hypothetical protein